jgi:hypothetical protein
MPKYRILELPGAPAPSRWTIEQVTPGEKPILISFFGRKSEAEAEVHRLNAGGKVEAKTPVTGRRKRPRSDAPR